MSEKSEANKYGIYCVNCTHHREAVGPAGDELRVLHQCWRKGETATQVDLVTGASQTVNLEPLDCHSERSGNGIALGLITRCGRGGNFFKPVHPLEIDWSNA